MVAFRKAVKREAKLRLAISGPSGSGKTYSALAIASALAGEEGSVAVVDTEHGSASKYADLFRFDVLELETFHPDRFVEAITAAASEGYTVLVIDSLSHAWNGKGGMLELVDGITKRSRTGNSFNAWGDATPIQNRLLDAITRAPMHVICTMRSKTEYVQEKDERTGKMTPRKVGMAPVQRDGVEYEFDVLLDMDQENRATVQKSRCPALSGQIIPKPGAQVAETLAEWLHGEPVAVAATPSPAPRQQGAPITQSMGERQRELRAQAQVERASRVAQGEDEDVAPDFTFSVDEEEDDTTSAPPAQPTARPAGKVASLQELLMRAKTMGIVGPRWGTLHKECGGDAARIQARLDEIEAERKQLGEPVMPY